MIRGELAAMPEATAKDESTGRFVRGSNATTDDRGATYALRRLKRDRPELAEHDEGPAGDGRGEDLSGRG